MENEGNMKENEYVGEKLERRNGNCDTKSLIRIFRRQKIKVLE